MMTESKVLLSQMLPRLNNTMISFVFVAVCFLVLYYFFRNKADTKKHQHIVRKRFIYMMLVIDLLIMTKIWIDGFSHIITVLSLMAAGLVVANKESVMNLIGGLIIHWRELFVEGDLIQIQNFSGRVFSIGMMYFRIYETVSIDQKQATGRTIKIPNSLVITAPVVNFSPDSNLYLYRILIKANEDIESHLNAVEKIITTILNENYADNPCYQNTYLKSHNRDLSSLVDLKPLIYLVPPVEHDDVLQIAAQFYCFPRDYHSILRVFWLRITNDALPK